MHNTMEIVACGMLIERSMCGRILAQTQRECAYLCVNWFVPNLC